MKYKLMIIACLLCSMAMAQNKTTGYLYQSNGKSESYYPVHLSGISATETIDTVYSTEGNLPVRTIQKVYTLSDSTKYTEKFKCEWNDKKQYWDFKSVSIVKGRPNNYITIGGSSQFPGGFYTTPYYNPR